MTPEEIEERMQVLVEKLLRPWSRSETLDAAQEAVELRLGVPCVAQFSLKDPGVIVVSPALRAP